MDEAQSQKKSKQIRKRKSPNYLNEYCIDYDISQGYMSKSAISDVETSFLDVAPVSPFQAPSILDFLS